MEAVRNRPKVDLGLDKKQQKRLEFARDVFSRLEKDPDKVSDAERLDAVQAVVDTGRLETFVPLLPAAMSHDGKPYTLDNHFPFEPLFSRNIPDNLCVISGRQVSKSTSLASRSLLIATSLPYFSSLYVAPLYEQTRRFSTQYVRKFIDESPLRSFWTGTSTENSVLQRSFKNFSKMYFSFATLSADRIRGISTNMCNFDECQDLDPNHLPVIRETMSHSKHGVGISIYTGTPKSLENTLEREWRRSSQAEWAIPCASCSKVNYPSIELDLDKMIGPWHEDIGEVRHGKKPATICARCSSSIDPRKGRWHHRKPHLRYTYPGFHVPQIIMPIHYADPKRWAKLLNKQSGGENYTTAKFYNEVLGVSYDVGAKLVTETDLIGAATLPFANNPRDFHAQAATKHRYIHRFLGVDWGGGGEDEVSFTTAAVVGMLADGRLEVFFGERLLTPHDPRGEAKRLMQIYNAFQCSHIAHDYNGAGSLREVFMLQAGLSQNRVVPLVYNRTAAKDIIVPHRAGDGDNSRNFWILDKARSLQYTCELVKMKHIKFFKYDYVDADNRGLLNDFLSLVEHKTETARAGEVYSIHRVAAFPDDFAHSVNFAACALFHHTQNWPSIAQLEHLRLSAEQDDAWNPVTPWHGAGDDSLTSFHQPYA